MPKQEAPKPEGPQVNDQFWFDLSKEWVQQSPSKLDEAAAKIQATVGWLWGVYTAGATIGIALSKSSYPWWVNILIALPSVVLIFAYWEAAQAQMPILQKFDPRAPSKIEESYSEIVDSKRKRFNCSLWLSLAAAVLVAIALITASFSHQAATPSFQAYLHTYEGRDTIVLSGHFPADTLITVKIASPQKAAGVLEEQHMTPSTGELQTNIALGSSAEEYNVTIEWTEKDGMVHSLQRTVPPQK